MPRAAKVGSRVRLKHRIGHLENAKGTVKEVFGDWLDVVVDGYSWHNEYDLERLSSDAVTVLKPDTPPPTSRDVMKFIMRKWPGLSYERIRFLDDVYPDPKDRARLLSDEALEEFDRCRWFFDVGPRAPLYTEPEIQMNNVYLQSLMRESENSRRGYAVAWRDCCRCHP